MISYPEISVIIPVKNEATKIRACIDGILSQTVPVKEIIVIDSGSIDGTLEILKEYDQVRLIEIKPENFNHGSTRNLGVSAASGEFCLFTVGDARAYDNNWIKHLLTGFDNDDTVAGVCGLQVVPHEADKNPLQWFRPVSKPKKVKYAFTEEAFDNLPPAEKRRICGWDNVTALYKKSTLIAVPFQHTPYFEDGIWAREAILYGYSIVYNGAARVYHFHLENKEFTFKRMLTTQYFRYKQFGYTLPKPRRTLLDPLKMLRIIWSSKGLRFGEKLQWFKYNQEQLKTALHAYNVFTSALAKGEEELDKVHSKYCGKPPIPSKMQPQFAK